MKARRTIAAILSILMVIGVFQISASAAERTPFGYIDEYQVDTGNTNYVAQHQTVLELLYDGCMAYQSSINVSQYNLTVSDYTPLRDALIGVYPELFFVKNASYSYSGTKLYSINPSYNVSQADAATMLTKFYAKADEYLALIDDEMDDFTKALVLHDALVLNNEYDIDRYVNNVYVYSSNYTFMVDGWGRCENYAECYAYLLAQVGIKSEIINSGQAYMQHEWMKIQLGGENYYYNVDVTWDDPVYDGIGDLPDKVSHSYFLLSDDAVDFSDHYGYEVINVSDETYDGYATLHSLENPVFYTNGALYTLYTKNNKGYIAIYHPDDDSLSDDYEITDRWSAGGGYWIGNFSGIGMDGGLLYYNGDNCVYCYDPAINASTLYMADVLTDGRHLYGLFVKDGVIYGRADTSPNLNNVKSVALGETIRPHAVTIAEEIQNGTVTSDKDSAMSGETVTLTVSPDKGYDVEAVYVNNDELAPVAGVYSFEMPNEDVSVTASFNEAEPNAKHSITLDGDIGLNFYYNLTDEQAENQTVSFTWTVDGQEKNAECELTEDAKNHLFKVTCPIPAAEMTAQVTATLTLSDKTVTETFSVVDYANYILSDDYHNAYLHENPNGETKYNELAELVKATLYYGARAQERFDRDVDHLADEGLDYTPGEVTAANINTQSSNMTDGLDEYGLTYKGATLVFLSESSLRHYYKVDDDDKFASVKNSVTFGSDEPIVYGEKDGQIYFELKNIAAAKLDQPYTIKIGDKEYSYSALDYVKACLLDDSIGDKMKALAAATYLYNQAANIYFND